MSELDIFLMDLSRSHELSVTGVWNAIELLEKQGYEYIYAPSISSDLPACDAQADSDIPTRKIQWKKVSLINNQISFSTPETTGK